MHLITGCQIENSKETGLRITVDNETGTVYKLSFAVTGCAFRNFYSGASQIEFVNSGSNVYLGGLVTGNAYNVNAADGVTIDDTEFQDVSFIGNYHVNAGTLGFDPTVENENVYIGEDGINLLRPIITRNASYTIQGQNNVSGFFGGTSSEAGVALGCTDGNKPYVAATKTVAGVAKDLALRTNNTTRMKLYSGGGINIQGLPTSDPGTVGDLWNDSGTLKIST